MKKPCTRAFLLLDQATGLDRGKDRALPRRSLIEVLEARRSSQGRPKRFAGPASTGTPAVPVGGHRSRPSLCRGAPTSTGLSRTRGTLGPSPWWVRTQARRRGRHVDADDLAAGESSSRPGEVSATRLTGWRGRRSSGSRVGHAERAGRRLRGPRRGARPRRGHGRHGLGVRRRSTAASARGISSPSGRRRRGFMT
jgi:hypothetical protein